MQLALDAPEVVHSLSLLEPPLVLGDGVPSGRRFIAEQFIEKKETSVQKMYEEGNKSKAIDTFLQLVCGREYHEVIDQALSRDAFELAVKDADTFFQVEVPDVRGQAVDRRRRFVADAVEMADVEVQADRRRLDVLHQLEELVGGFDQQARFRLDQ